MIFSKHIGVRPLFDRVTCTYTYLVYDSKTLEAVIIDPVRETFVRDKRIIGEMGLKLLWCLETHVHADHVTAASLFKKEFSLKVGLSDLAPVSCDDVILFADGEELEINDSFRIKFFHTPGHTSCSVSFHVEDLLFTGDTLFIKGCGRTDFQGGSATSLYESVHQKIYTLADSTIILPGHNYQGEMFSTIGEEKKFNPRLKMDISKNQFCEIMDNLNLPYPEKIDFALPLNKRCGKEAS